jgi:uncharacterized protein involved in exopolysaccharide biosynthesis
MHELAPYTMRLTFPAEREETAVLIEPMRHEEERLSLQDCWWVITKRLRLIALFFVGTILTTGLVMLLMPATYTAEVTLLIERKPPRILDIHEASVEPLVPDEYDFYKTQYELLKSRALAAQVIRDLGLNPTNLQKGESKGLLEGITTHRR